MSTNVATNPGAELGVTTGWSIANGSLAATTDEARSGTHAFAASWTGSVSTLLFYGNGSQGNCPAASEGETWELRWWIMSPDGVTITPALRWFGGANGTGSVVSSAVGDPVTATSTWQEVSVAGTAPSGTASLMPRLQSGTGTSGNVLYIDDIRIQIPTSGISHPVIRIGTPHLGPLRIGD